MLSLEEKTKKGATLTISAIGKGDFCFGSSIGEEFFVKGCEAFEEGLNIFGEEFNFKVPNLFLKNASSEYVNGCLEEGFKKGEVYLGTKLVLNYDPDKSIYVSKLEIVNKDWINYIKVCSNKQDSREIAMGWSSKGFKEAYAEMVSKFGLQ
jgi:hypothetical protein